MSIRLSEKYQNLDQKNGSNSYRIYNLEIFSRSSIQQEPQTLDQEELSQKYEKRCQFRELSFVEPQIHFYDEQRHRQHRNLQNLTDPNEEEENPQNGIMYMYSQNQPTRLQRSGSCYADEHRKVSNMSHSQQEQSNSEENSPQYVMKRISNDKGFKNQEGRSPQFCQQYIPDLSIAQAVSTQIMISSQKYKQNLKQKSFLKISPSQHELNINKKTLSQHTNYNIQNTQPYYGNQYQHGGYIQYGNFKQFNDKHNENLNFMTKRDDSEYQNKDVELKDNQEEFKGNKTILINNWNGKNLNQMTNKSLNLNTNNSLIINKMNYNNKSIQNQQIWSNKQENLLINNKKLVGKEKQIYPSDGYKSQISCDIPIMLKEEEKKIQLFDENNGNITDQHNQNNSPKMSINMSEIHNSELFKALSMEYKQIPKNNTLKNIKKAFIRYLLKTNRKQLIKKCEQFNLNASYILTVLCQEIKYDHRHNKNIRFLLKSEQISPLFKDFLENSEDYWFSNSSLLNAEPCRQMVNLLLKLTSNALLIDVIQEYEK